MNKVSTRLLYNFSDAEVWAMFQAIDRGVEELASEGQRELAELAGNASAKLAARAAANGADWYSVARREGWDE